MDVWHRRGSAWLALVAALAVLPASAARASGSQQVRIARLSQRIAEAPSDLRLLARRAELLCEQNEIEAAEADFEQIRQVDPAWHQIHLLRARCLLAQRRLDEARDAIASFRMREPDDAEGMRVDAEILFEQRRWEEADALYVRYLTAAERPKPQDYIHASEAIAQRGPDHIERAARVLEWGLSKLGNIASIRERAIQLALDAGDPEGALRRVDEAMTSGRKEQRNDVRWLVWRGDVLSKLGRAEEARSAYHAAVRAIDRRPPARRESSDLVALRVLAERGLAQLP